MGRVRQIEETPIEISAKAVRGIICFDFSRYVSDMFVVGVEGGLVVQCSMLGTNSLLGNRYSSIFVASEINYCR